jgi:hypothetical protein
MHKARWIKYLLAEAEEDNDNDRNGYGPKTMLTDTSKVRGFDSLRL